MGPDKGELLQTSRPATHLTLGTKSSCSPGLSGAALLLTWIWKCLQPQRRASVYSKRREYKRTDADDLHRVCAHSRPGCELSCQAAWSRNVSWLPRPKSSSWIRTAVGEQQEASITVWFWHVATAHSVFSQRQIRSSSLLFGEIDWAYSTSCWLQQVLKEFYSKIILMALMYKWVWVNKNNIVYTESIDDPSID